MQPIINYGINGALRFGFASLLVYATVAFAEGWMYQTLGLTGAYIVWTVLFIGLGGTALKSLAGSISFGKFFIIFGLAFLMYAVGWSASYFILKGATGEWVGSLTGSLLLALVFAGGFKAWPSFVLIAVVVFIGNSIGYFLGAALNQSVGGKPGMLLWGAAHGVFLGAALGKALYFVKK